MTSAKTGNGSARAARAMVTAAVLAAGTLAAGGAYAQQVSENPVAAETDWTIFEESDPQQCWAVSIPKQTVNTRDGQTVEVTRSEIQLMAFFRPGAAATGQIAFTGGYPFADGSTVTLNVGDSDFELYTQGEWAWPATPEDDGRIITAMKSGAEAVLTGRSSRGTQTRDTFSLMGFTAAVDDSARRCAG